jgi:hypothetical protein
MDPRPNKPRRLDLLPPAEEEEEEEEDMDVAERVRARRCS